MYVNYCPKGFSNSEIQAPKGMDKSKYRIAQLPKLVWKKEIISCKNMIMNVYGTHKRDSECLYSPECPKVHSLFRKKITLGYD